MSNQYKIGVIVGSLRTNSYNRQVAEALVKLFPDHFTFNFLDISELPLYNQDADKQLPSVVANFKSQIAECDGIIFVTPEYNRSIPGVLKNAIDHASRPAGNNSWNGKPAGHFRGINRQYQYCNCAAALAYLSSIFKYANHEST